MNWQIVLTQPSTIRGIVWIIGSFNALLFLAFSSPEKAMAVMSITGVLAGGLGAVVSDEHK